MFRAAETTVDFSSVSFIVEDFAFDAFDTLHQRNPGVGPHD